MFSSFLLSRILSERSHGKTHAQSTFPFTCFTGRLTFASFEPGVLSSPSSLNKSTTHPSILVNYRLSTLFVVCGSNSTKTPKPYAMHATTRARQPPTIKSVSVGRSFAQNSKREKGGNKGGTGRWGEKKRQQRNATSPSAPLPLPTTSRMPRAAGFRPIALRLICSLLGLSAPTVCLTLLLTHAGVR